MAKDKKSFILYADQLEHFEDLTDEEAGQLIKHVFRYVNDKNPEAPNRIIQVAFNPVKQQLKRDLKTYECTKDERSKSGILGNLKKYNLDLFDKVIAEKLTLDEAQSIAKTRKASQSEKVVANLAVNDNVNDNVNVISLNRSDDFALQCLQDQIWKEAIFMQKVLNPLNIEFALKDYNIHLTQQGENKNSLKDYKSHFVNWVKKKKELKAKDVQYQNKDRL